MSQIVDNFSKSNVDGKAYWVTEPDGSYYTIVGKTLVADGKIQSGCPENLVDTLKSFADFEEKTVSLLHKEGFSLFSADAQPLFIFGNRSLDEEQILEGYCERYNIAPERIEKLGKVSLSEKTKNFDSIVKAAQEKAQSQENSIKGSPDKKQNR